MGLVVGIVIAAAVVVVALVLVSLYNRLVRLRNRSENALTAALGRLFAVAEAYPQLRATENFQQLQAQLADVEQNIAVARQVYNDTVLTYDNALETVPSNIFAGMFNFGPKQYFEIEDAAREAPRVQFST